jgi:predicted kinase
MKPSIHILVGLPGTGKSTWMRSYIRDNNATIISSDDIIEEYGKLHGLNYNEAYRLVNFKNIEHEMQRRYKEAVAAGSNIIIDRTNMTVKSRRQWLNGVKSYNKIAVIFLLDDNTHRERLSFRAKTEGKTIPNSVIDSMARSYVCPTKEEGFDQIITIRG